MSQVAIVSEMDKEFLSQLRKNVDDFLRDCAEAYARPNTLLLDVAPQVHAGALPHFKHAAAIETLDIDPNSGATWISDLCKTNSEIPSSRFDYVVCTEVLEHTRQPFHAVDEIYRLLKPGGLVFISTPFNFRIHGPLPDCWRFTEYGLRELLLSFNVLSIKALGAPERDLMPIHYTVVAQKPL